MASCVTEGAEKQTNCCRSLIFLTRSGGPIAHPTFHPVVENVLPADDMVSVRENMSGRVAKEM